MRSAAATRPRYIVVEPHRADLRAHCYRILGSLHDADDALQETLLRAWRPLPRFGGPGRLRPLAVQDRDERLSGRIARRRKRLFTTNGARSWSWRSSRHCSISRRAVPTLRDVLGFSAAEVADQLNTSVASVNGALRRAR